MDRNVSSAELWQQHARRTVRRVNLGWWLQSFAPWAAGLGLVLMGVVLWLRSQGKELPWGPMVAVLVGVYGVTGLICWLVARRRFARMEEGMVVLEARLKLNNALSAAAGGVTAWPPVPEKVDDGFRFRGPWLMAPAVLTVACLSMAFLLPVSQAVAPPALPPPLSLTRAEDILNTLEKEDVADPQALEKAREQLQALLNQAPEDYYTHHSLEAADALETSLGEAAGNLGQQLQTAAQTAESLEKYDSSLSPSAREQLETDLKSAIEGIKNSSFGASEALQKQLGQLDPSKLKELDPAQMKKMMENLKAKSAACKNCKGGACEAKSEAEKALAELLGNKKGKGQGEEGEGPGKGDVQRGPGTEEIGYSNDPNDLSTNKLEQLESQDLSRTLPGDHLGTRDVEHQLDKTGTGPMAGGAVSTPAGGGDAVWRDQLLPSEQKVLRKYFR